MRLLHTMIRVNDLAQSIEFYTKGLGMKLLRQSENPEYKYSLAFLGYGDEDNTSVIELTYNWGQNNYDHGSAFGHLAIGADDIQKACDDACAFGGKLIRPVGAVKGGSTVIAFVEDPNGYKIEFIENKSAKSGLGN